MKPASDTVLAAPFAWIDIPGKGYAIAKYPLTNAQFAPFIEADGYGQRRWWTDEGWDAKENGLTFDFMQGGPANGEPWTAPRFWHDAQFNGADFPVVGITWHEAVAYCRWLSDITGQDIVLPSETQWQYAAQGDDSRLYPWGDTWDCTRCNNSVAPCQSDGTTPVRQYDGVGDSPFGVVDMSGNVWEWCLSEYTHKMSDLPMRVVRGGGWYYFSKADCRTNFSYGDVPYSSYNFRGFRLARSNG